MIDNVVNVLTKPLPIGNHPFFDNAYNNFAKRYNALSERLENKGIDIAELQSLLEATKELERLGYLEAYRLGFNDGSNK